MGFEGIRKVPFFHFDRPVNRFLGGFRPNRGDERISVVKPVRNIYRFIEFEGV